MKSFLKWLFGSKNNNEYKNKKINDDVINPATKAKDRLYYIEKGKEKERLGDYEWALKYYNKIMKENSNDFQAYYHIGKIKELQGAIDEALEYYKKSTESFSNWTKPYTARAAIRFTQWYYPAVNEECNKALAITESDSDAYFYRAKAKIKRFDYSGAVKDYDKSIEYHRYDSTVWLAEIYKEQEELLVFLYLQIKPVTHEEFWSRWRARNKKGDYKWALIDMNKAIELNKTDADKDFIYKHIRNDLISQSL